MVLTLARFCYSPLGVFGRLNQFYTVERPWLNNQPFLSCIPTGTYLCVRKTFPKHGETFEVTGVPGRSAILFHAGNTIHDFEGCIGLGLGLGAINGYWAVTASRAAMAEFFNEFAEINEFQLTVIAQVPP